MGYTNGFTNIMLDGANKIYGVGYKLVEWNKKVQGTHVIVERVKQTSTYRQVFGVSYNDGIAGNTETERFDHTIVINRNNMLKVWNVTAEDLTFLDIGEALEMGDTIIFSRGKLEYSYKITDIQTLTDVGGIVRQYTITPLSSVFSTEEGGAYRTE